MIKKLIIIIGSILPNLLFAQKHIWDTENKKTLAEDCHNKVFDKVETLPSLIVSLDAYADSVRFFLKQKQINLKGKKVIFRFIVTSRSEIFDLTLISPVLDEQEDLEASILNFSNLWVPARQNSHIVCSYVNLEMSFAKDKLDIRIYQ